MKSNDYFTVRIETKKKEAFKKAVADKGMKMAFVFDKMVDKWLEENKEVK